MKKIYKKPITEEVTISMSTPIADEYVSGGAQASGESYDAKQQTTDFEEEEPEDSPLSSIRFKNLWDEEE